MHVDGFRFDLAPTLARGHDGFDPTIRSSSRPGSTRSSAA
jgi:pullulanase/glycogen debranching enzyme